MAFNECTFGFVPHSGATFYLSRLPSEFGTFLALTGLPIHGTDAAKLKLVDGILQTSKHVEDDVADAVYSMGYNPREHHEMLVLHEEQVRKGGEYRSNRLESMVWRDERNMELDVKGSRLGSKLMMDDHLHGVMPFMEAKDRLPSSVGGAEGWYMNLMRQEQLKHS